MSEEEIIKRINFLIMRLIEERKEGKLDISDIKLQEAMQGLLYLYNKEKENNKILEDKIITIRKLTKPYIVWYDTQTENFQLKGCNKQEIYKNFAKIRAEVKGEYCFLSDEGAIQKILNKED